MRTQQRVVQPRDEPGDDRGLEPAGEERRSHHLDSVGVSREARARREPLDPPHDRDGTLRGAAQDVARGEQPDDRAVPRDRQVVEARLEQHCPRVVERRLGRHGAQGPARDLRDGHVGTEPCPEDPLSQVAVGDDAGRIRPDEDRRDALLPHDSGRLADRGVRLHPDRRPADELIHPDREIGLEGRDRRLLEARPEPLREPDGEVARELRVGEEPVEDLGGQPIREEVFLRDDVEGGRLGDEGGVSEDLPLLDDLERLAAPVEAHRPLADDVQVLQRLPAGLREPGSRRVEGDLERARDLVEQGRRKRLERRHRSYEDDRIDRCHAPTIARTPRGAVRSRQVKKTQVTTANSGRSTIPDQSM